MDKSARVAQLITLWEVYDNATAPATADEFASAFNKLRGDLYLVRNAGSGICTDSSGKAQACPPITSWPAYLIDGDDEIMASVEHYFLCRYLVGAGLQPAWEMRAQVWIYDTGKKRAPWAVPRANPGKPVTPPSAMQSYYQELGIRDGEKDLARFGTKAPKVARPVQYFNA